jgi:hypothetical protein
MKGIIYLGLLILIPIWTFAQELNDKIPLLDEPMFIQKEEKSTNEKFLIPSQLPKVKEAEEKILGTPTTQPLIDTKAIDVGTPTSKTHLPIETPTTPAKIPEEAFTKTLVSVRTPTIGTTTTDIDTPTSKKPEEIKLLNTGLILIPTAYRRDNKIGFNTDFIIAYYIGELWYKYKYNEGKEDSGFFEPIKFLFLSGDFKFSLLKEREKIPHFGAGYEWFLVLQGSAPSPAQMGGEFSGKSDRFGFPYFILSKEFKNIRYHLGMMSGEIGKLLNPLSKYMEVDAKKTLIFGIDTRLFDRKINIEGIYPLGSKFHLLVNTSIERFIGFELAFMKTPDGISVVGYFGVRLTIFPYIKD